MKANFTVDLPDEMIEKLKGYLKKYNWREPTMTIKINEDLRYYDPLILYNLSLQKVKAEKVKFETLYTNE